MEMNRWAVDELRPYIEDYLRQKGLSIRRPFRCISPDHADRNPSMSYNRKAYNVHCFGCGATFDLFDLIGMDYGLSNFADQLQKAGELFGVSVSPALQAMPPKPVKPAPPSGSLDLELKRLQEQSNGDIAYFVKRGISENLVNHYGLFQTGDRAYFPVVERGILTGWCGRAVREGIEPRYKNSKGSIGIWNADLLQISGQGQPLYITEGVIDALSLEQMGCKAVALCSAQNAGKLLDRVKAAGESAKSWRYILCGDADEAGQKMNAALREGLLELGLSCQVLLPQGEDWNALYLQDRAALSNLLRDAVAEEEKEPDRSAYNATSAAADLDAFFAQRELRAGLDAVATGFPGLDKLLGGGLFPGLYVLGAISSLGKTSLALQMADYIAANDRDVLFVSLEQSRFELMAKSLSRVSTELAGEQCAAFTVRELLSGEPAGSFARRDLLEQSRQVYADTAKGLFLREGLADIGTGELRRMVAEHLKNRGKAPVLVVDYLQILAPSESRCSDKQNTDRAVVELKRISRDFDIPVLAISSFNRENYKTAVSMEAFKESGAVEYSADVLMGLQLAGAGARDFDVNQAKLRDPRQVELVILKNRNGLPYAKLRLEYEARFNRFWQGSAAAVRFGA